MSAPLIAMVIVFVVGYAAIAFEHQIRIDKAASALITGVLCWAIYILWGEEILHNMELPLSFTESLSEKGMIIASSDLIHHYIAEFQLTHHLGEISSILFFLLGAMTIVELVDAFEGFSIITDRIKTVNKLKLLWIISVLTFFFSAVLDNLTTSIVMVSLLRKLISGRSNRLFFAGMVVVSANAGGAWSPIGDVTTTMLWIGGQITAQNIVVKLIIPSLVCMIIPLIYLSFTMKGEIERPDKSMYAHDGPEISQRHKSIMFTAGVLGLLFVPVFKTVTHLPPYMGMLLSLGVIWIISEVLNHKMDQSRDSSTHVIQVLKRIDTPSILFFLGILTAITALESTFILEALATTLDNAIGNQNAIVIVIGLLSAIVDNVPLVAAAMGMYNFPTDSIFWEFLAYCAGTGGSSLIIGSAAGVAVMGMERIDFFWYARRIAPLALLGYFAGAVVYILMYSSF